VKNEYAEPAFCADLLRAQFESGIPPSVEVQERMDSVLSGKGHAQRQIVCQLTKAYRPMRDGDFDGAYRQLQKALATAREVKHPDEELNIWLLLAKCCLKLDKCDEAENASTRVLAGCGKRAPIYLATIFN
jgi:thioredoxin-like negative regulator of GroEL